MHAGTEVRVSSRTLPDGYGRAYLDEADACMALANRMPAGSQAYKDLVAVAEWYEQQYIASEVRLPAQLLINSKSRRDARPPEAIIMPSENDDRAYTDALRQEVLELVPTALPRSAGRHSVPLPGPGWTTPPMAVMHVMPDGLRGIVPYGTAPV